MQISFERVANFQERRSQKNEQRNRYLKEKVQTIESLETEEQKMVEELKHTKQQQTKLLDKLKIKIAGRRFTEQVRQDTQKNNIGYFNIRDSRTARAADPSH